jgi:hypothetical protein
MLVGSRTVTLRLQVALCFALLTAYGPLAAQETHGRYLGRLAFVATPDGRRFELIEPFAYIDRAGREWLVPAGTKVDGASIPSALWSMFGAPFTGKYREASVIHDHFCDLKTRSSNATHMVFYEAMLASGEDPRRAKLMYYAVLRFGPRWEVSGGSWSWPSGGQRFVLSAPFDESDFEKMRLRLEVDDLALKLIESEATLGRRPHEVITCQEAVRDGPSACRLRVD